MSSSSSQVLFFLNGRELIGDKNSTNTIFSTPSKFLQDGSVGVVLNRNGQEQLLGFDYIVGESGGLGTGFDTIIIRKPPRIFDSLICHYIEDC